MKEKIHIQMSYNYKPKDNFLKLRLKYIKRSKKNFPLPVFFPSSFFLLIMVTSCSAAWATVINLGGS